MLLKTASATNVGMYSFEQMSSLHYLYNQYMCIALVTVKSMS